MSIARLYSCHSLEQNLLNPYFWIAAGNLGGLFSVLYTAFLLCASSLSVPIPTKRKIMLED